VDIATPLVDVLDRRFGLIDRRLARLELFTFVRQRARLVEAATELVRMLDRRRFAPAAAQAAGNDGSCGADAAGEPDEASSG
jgi:hypothetical protein